MHDGALGEAAQGTGGERCPRLVVGQRQGGDDGDAVVGAGDFAEVDIDVLVRQVCFGKRRLAHDVVQARGSVRKQGVTVGEQEIEFAVFADVERQVMQFLEQFSGAGQVLAESVA